MVRVDDDAEIPESGAVFTFGKSKFADNVPSKFWIRNDVIKAVSCGDEHSVAVTGNGRIYVFGSNEWGQLGVANKKTVTKPYCLKALKHEKGISAAGGRAHTLITTESGKVYTFGGNSEGQLGVGDNDSRSEPCVISGLDGHVVAVSAGSYHSVLLTADGDVYVFGSNSEGQLGLSDVQKVSSPTKLQLGVPISDVSCGYYHTALVSKDGKVYTFGEKDSGKLGLLEKQLNDGANRKPQCIFSITENVVAASCGGNHTAVVTECGKLYTFGSGLNGQLGLGTMIMETASPSLVGALDAETIVSVACGESHTAIVTNQGKIYTCGDGRHGKLGLGDENFSNQFNPVPLKKFNGYFVRQVACGGCHMLVLASKVTEVNENDTNSADEVETESNVNGVRSRRRLKDLQANQTASTTFGRPLPPLGTTGTTFNDTANANTEENANVEQLNLANAVDSVNGNDVAAEEEQKTNLSTETEVKTVVANSEALTTTPPQQAVVTSSDDSAATVTAEPAAKLKEEAAKDKKSTAKDESSSGGSESESSSDDEEINKSNQIECRAVIEPEPPPPPLLLSPPSTLQPPTDVAHRQQNSNKDVDEENKKVKKKFWTFGRKKSVSERVETSREDVKAFAAPPTPVPAEEKAAPAVENKPRSATSIFNRSTNNATDSKTSNDKKQTASNNKSSACVIL